MFNLATLPKYNVFANNLHISDGSWKQIVCLFVRECADLGNFYHMKFKFLNYIILKGDSWKDTISIYMPKTHFLDIYF